jgi:hypothetical protein
LSLLAPRSDTGVSQPSLGHERRLNLQQQALSEIGPMSFLSRDASKSSHPREPEKSKSKPGNAALRPRTLDANKLIQLF